MRTEDPCGIAFDTAAVEHRRVGERDGAAGAGGDWNSADVLAVLRQLADPERARPFCVGIGLVIESSLKTMPQKFQQVGWLDDQEIRGGTKCPLTAMAEGEEDPRPGGERGVPPSGEGGL